MPRSELTVQSEIVKSVKAQEGYAWKQSHRDSIGIVDIRINLPPFGSMEAEVKYLGRPNEKFTRKLKVTDLQRRHMRLTYESGGFPFILVGLITGADHCLVAVPWDTVSIDDGFVDKHAWCTRKVGCKYNMRSLIEDMKEKTHG